MKQESTWACPVECQEIENRVLSNNGSISNFKELPVWASETARLNSSDGFINNLSEANVHKFN